MCKLLIMTGITEGLVAEEFMKRMATPMSKFNSHGIGYTAVSPDGQMFSERWHNNDQFASTQNVMTPEVAEALMPYEARLPKGALDANYSVMGTPDFNNVRTITMHTRYATCGKEFANTHPFIYDDTSLIHNGTIRNAFTTHYSTGLDVNKISTCDSEAALQTYLSQGVNLDGSKAKSWLDLLSGSWAFGILSRNTEGNRILDVVRGTSYLYYMQIEGLGKVFTTDDSDAKDVVKSMGLTFIEEPFLVKHDQMYRYDAITGEFLTELDIKPVYKSHGNSYTGKQFGATTTQSGMSNRSINVSRPGQALLTMVDALRDEPDFMSHMPDIFTEASTPKNLKIDFRKVKKYTSDETIMFIDRLDVFDMVFNTSMVAMYEKLPNDLRDYVRQTSSSEGAKAARSLLQALDKKRKDSVVG